MGFELPEILYTLPRFPIISVGLPLSIGFLNARVARHQVKNWFSKLEKPSSIPHEPNLFPLALVPVYAGMGLSAYFVASAFNSAAPGSTLKATAKLALKLHYAQYGFNLLWTPLLFGAHQIGASLINLSIMTPIAFASAHYACKSDRRTVYCLAPYTLWVLYTNYLHLGLWWVNRDDPHYRRK